MPQPSRAYKDGAGPNSRLEWSIVSQYRDVGLAVQYMEQFVSCRMAFPRRHSRERSDEEAALVERAELPESRLRFLLGCAGGNCEHLKVPERCADVSSRNRGRLLAADPRRPVCSRACPALQHRILRARVLC